MMDIIVDIKTQYGTERIFPRTHMREIQKITGRVTIRREDLSAWDSLGFAFLTPESVKL